MSKETLIAVGRVIKELKAEYASELVAAIAGLKAELHTQLEASADTNTVQVESLLADTQDTLSAALANLQGMFEAVQPHVDEKLTALDAETVGRITKAANTLRAEHADADVQILAEARAQLDTSMGEVRAEIEKARALSLELSDQTNERHAEIADRVDSVFATLQAQLTSTEEKLAVLIEKSTTFTAVEISKVEAVFEETRKEDLERLASTERAVGDLQDTTAVNDQAFAQIRETLTVETDRVKGRLSDLRQALDTQRSAQALELAAVIVPLQEEVKQGADKLATFPTELDSTIAPVLARVKAQDERITQVVSNEVLRDQNYLKDLKVLRGDLYDKFATFQEGVDTVDTALGEALKELEANTDVLYGNTQQRIAGVQDSVSVLSNKIKGVSEQFGETLSEQVATITASIAGVREALNAVVAEEAVARADDVGSVHELIAGIPDLTPALDEITKWSESVEDRWQAFEKRVYDTISEVGLGANTQIEKLGETVTALVKGLADDQDTLADDQDTLAENLSARMTESDTQLETVRAGVDEVQTKLAGVDERITTMHEVLTLNPEHPRATAGRVYRYRNALWLCHKDTVELPSVSNPDWELHQDALTGLSVDQDTPDTLAVVETWASGKTKVHTIELPKVKYLKTYDATLLYQKYDSVIDDGHRWVAVKDNPNGAPHKSADWFLFGMRGPQGKRGPKGERGIQGAPGKDAPVLKEIVNALAAFMDNQGGIPVKRFMGMWIFQNPYLRGDIVATQNRLFLASEDNDGTIPPLDPLTGGTVWLLLWESPNYPLWTGTKWAGLYVAGADYKKNDMVRDGNWTMVAVADTNARPAPQRIGDHSFDVGDNPGFANQSHTGTVVCGHEYVFTKSGWIDLAEEWKAEIGPNVSYRFLSVNHGDGTGVPKTRIITSPPQPEVVDAWAFLAQDPIIVLAGDRIEVRVEIINSSGSTPYTGAWTRAKDENDSTKPPGDGNWGTRGNGDSLRISKIDDNGTDRTADLLLFGAGTQVIMTDADDPTAYESWSLGQDPVDQGDFYNWANVTYLGTGPSGKPTQGTLCTMDAEVPIAQPTLYPQATDYWVANQPDWATVQGFVELDGAAAGQFVLTDNAHGIRLEFQEGTSSSDWQMMALNSIAP